MSDNIQLLDKTKEKALRFLKERGVLMEPKSFSIDKEEIFGDSFCIVTIHYNNSENIEIAFDVNQIKAIDYKNELIKIKSSHSFVNVTMVVFLLVAIILYFFNLPRVALFSTPLLFGWALYKLSYSTAKTYLKKITDTMTFLSAALTASALLCGITPSQFLYNHTENDYLKAGAFIVLQTFAIFATTKFCISTKDTIDESKLYYGNSDTKNNKRTNKKTIVQRICMNFFATWLFVKTKTHDYFNDKLK
ncbi:hypothetical protein HWQ17_12520 [Enterobacter pasteurii]|uniref:hypothetical protein n=1 Tax=Enterobacter pasteurii TaxID=3029761 RepID=UPI0011DDE333|nr:hypothetical protein [Enterobacter pasteurii]QLA68394.1 hypothetical protein HWQ17_12520 [Enterobacter pasteurii]